MNGKMLMAFVSLGFAIGCEPSSKTEGKISNATSTKSLGRQIVGFNWSSSDERIDTFLKGAIANAQELNQKILNMNDVPEGALAGHGLYLASDPLQSTVYGTELTCVTLEASASWRGLIQGDSKISAIASPDSVLRYPFTVGILPLPGSSDSPRFEYAAVVRDLNAIDIGKSKKISFRREGAGEGLNQQSLRDAQTALSRKDVCGVLSAFEGEFSTLVYALHAAAPKAVWDGMTKLAPLFRASFDEARPIIGDTGMAIGKGLRARLALLAELKKSDWFRSRDESDLAVASAVFTFVYNVSSESEILKGNGDPQDWQKELLTATGLFQVRPESKTWSDLKQDMENSLNKRFQDWGRAHPVETQLMQQWLQELERVRLASLK
ncbi:MAG: hypothetical protein RL189_1163 [Pseudomonadota bacterium]|jgi:hypothetical protein